MKYINKKNKIFIAGHRGMVGSAIMRNLQKNGYHNLLTSERAELDLTDNNKVSINRKSLLENNQIIVSLN